jgi:hypothetical protein
MTTIVMMPVPDSGLFWVSIFNGDRAQVNMDDNKQYIRAMRNF